MAQTIKTHVEHACEETDWPLAGVRITIEADLEPDQMPESAQRRALKEALDVARTYVHEGAVTIEARGLGEPAPEELQQQAETWSIPEDLHMKSAKAAHRFLVAIASLLERGPAPTLAEVADKARLSMPPVYRFVDTDTPAGAYLDPLVTVSKRGRAKVIDLTPVGRQVASRIRAKLLPS